MKAKQFTQLLAILALATLTFAACKKGTSNNNNANNTNNSNNTSNTTANTYVPPKPSTGDYSTPTAAFKTFYEAAKANNIEGIKRSLSRKSIEEATKESSKEKKTVDELFQEIVKDAPSKMPDVRNEKIDGDKATIEFKDDKMENYTTAHFVKEDGQWKIALRDESAAGMDNMDHGDMDKK